MNSVVDFLEQKSTSKGTTTCERPLMTSQLYHFRCLFLSCQQQKNTKNGAAVTSLRSFVFRDDFNDKLKIKTKDSIPFFRLFTGETDTGFSSKKMKRAWLPRAMLTLSVESRPWSP